MARDSYSQKPEYTTKDFRDPIVLLRASQRPDEEGEGWHTKVKPYAELWAAYEEGVRRVTTAGGQKENKSVHTFVFRFDATLIVAQGDFIVHEDTLYVIDSTRVKRGRSAFMIATCSIAAGVLTGDVEVDETIEVAQKPDNASNNPFFTDENDDA